MYMEMIKACYEFLVSISRIFSSRGSDSINRINDYVSRRMSSASQSNWQQIR
jgi:hypothetical protein